MRERGTVVSLENDTAVVQINRGEKCDGCTVCKSFGESKMRLQALNPIHAQVGDDVDVEIESHHIIRNSLLIFILPLVLMMVGYFVGISLSPTQSEGAGIFGAFIALAMALLGLRFIELLNKKSTDDAVIVTCYEHKGKE